ncbi:hypothetical protein [Pseudorhizobium xiangyangii]|nr:hypothetical protein [Neorhizobium xiangyangii]
MDDDRLLGVQAFLNGSLLSPVAVFVGAGPIQQKFDPSLEAG